MTETKPANEIQVRRATITDVPALFSIRTSVHENHLDAAPLADRGLTLAGSAEHGDVRYEKDLRSAPSGQLSSSA